MTALPVACELEMPLFSATDLTCIRGETLVFARLNFVADKGDALILVGPNGSGKSSLLRVMAGLLKPASGELLWEGQPVAEEPDEHHARLHYVGHHDCVKPVLTVAENIRFWASLRGAPEDLEARLEASLALFDIGHLRDIPGRFLSAGQKRRTNLARIVAAPAPLWLLDEPTTALDKATVARLEEAIATHQQAGGLVVISTHHDVGLENQVTVDLAEFSTRLAPGWHPFHDDTDEVA